MSNLAIPFDTSALITGSELLTVYGHGIIAQLLPSTGDDGPSIAYNDGFVYPADFDKQVRAEITVLPASGTLYVYEDTSFSFLPVLLTPQTATYRLFVDGVLMGTANILLITGAGVESTILQATLIPSSGEVISATVTSFLTVLIPQLVESNSNVFVSLISPYNDSQFAIGGFSGELWIAPVFSGRVFIGE